MADSLSVNLKGLKELIARFNSPKMKSDLEQLAQSKGIVALVAQAIADNFAQQGPGWQKLKSIRAALTKAGRKKFDKTGDAGGRMILQKSRTLMKSATTPGASGNIYRTEGTHLIFGTNLIYAGIHNSGGIIKHPGTANGFGRKIKIPPHNIPMPKREFMKIRDEWKNRINNFIVDKALQTILKNIKGGG